MKETRLDKGTEKTYRLLFVILTVFEQELYSTLSYKNGHLEKQKITLKTVMERDSKNSAPLLDKEPKLTISHIYSYYNHIELID